MVFIINKIYERRIHFKIKHIIQYNFFLHSQFFFETIIENNTIYFIENSIFQKNLRKNKI